jgi:uncharacterized protein YciI
MFVIELTYKAPLADIDASMPAHVKFLKKFRASQRADDIEKLIDR